MAQVLKHRSGRGVEAELEDEAPAASAPAPPMAAALLALQRAAGNRAVAALVQRQFADEGRLGEAPLGGRGQQEVDAEEVDAGDVDAEEVDAEEVEAEEVDAEEVDGRGPAHEARLAKPQAAATSEFGEMDGPIRSGVHPCAVTDLDRTGQDLWHHCGGQGGKGNEDVGSAMLVAPKYKTGPSSRTTGKPKAWIEDKTGEINVTRSFWGVPRGPQGAFVEPPPGTVWMTSAARERVDKHEREHAKKTQEIHERHIAPLEKRIAKRRGGPTGPDHPMRGDTEKKALAKLKAEIDWNSSVKAFVDEEKAENSPMAAVDQADMATADFYDSYGPRKIHGVVYSDYYDVPPGPKSRKKKGKGKGKGKSKSAKADKG